MQTIVVDPSRTVLKIVGQLLETAGHRAHAFTDGCEALDCLRSNPDIEAMITSVELPTISGLDLCRMARTLSSSHRPIYIMVMSSNREQGKLRRSKTAPTIISASRRPPRSCTRACAQPSGSARCSATSCGLRPRTR